MKERLRVLESIVASRTHRLDQRVEQLELLAHRLSSDVGRSGDEGTTGTLTERVAKLEEDAKASDPVYEAAMHARNSHVDLRERLTKLEERVGAVLTLDPAGRLRALESDMDPNCCNGRVHHLLDADRDARQEIARLRDRVAGLESRMPREADRRASRDGAPELREAVRALHRAAATARRTPTEDLAGALKEIASAQARVMDLFVEWTRTGGEKC